MQDCWRIVRNLISTFAHWMSLSTRLKILNSIQQSKALLMRVLCLFILFQVSRLALFSKRFQNIMVFVTCPWKIFPLWFMP